MKREHVVGLARGVTSSRVLLVAVGSLAALEVASAIEGRAHPVGWVVIVAGIWAYARVRARERRPAGKVLSTDPKRRRSGYDVGVAHSHGRTVQRVDRYLACAVTAYWVVSLLIGLRAMHETGHFANGVAALWTTTILGTFMLVRKRVDAASQPRRSDRSNGSWPDRGSFPAAQVRYVLYFALGATVVGASMFLWMLRPADLAMEFLRGTVGSLAVGIGACCLYVWARVRTQ